MRQVQTILAKALGRAGASGETQAMSQEQKRDLLARLLANLAHEIRNPLSSLDIHVQLLEEDLAVGGPDPAKRSQERFQIIHGEIRRLENIVTRFLQLAGPSALSVTTFSVNALVNHTCDLLRPQAKERGIDLTVKLADNLPQIEADSDQLTQALINLVINALQAAPNKGHVRVRTAAVTGGAVTVEINDDGPGIPPDSQGKIFEPYYTTKQDGSGLGLWITQQIVSAHGGTIHLESTQRRGASFTVTLPVRHLPQK